MRSWNWEIDLLDFDFPAMMSSLITFCARQFLGRRISYNLQLAVEELTMHHLLPTARKHRLSDPRIAYTVSVPENGETAHLDINLARFVEAGINLWNIQKNADEISATMLRQIVADQTLSNEGVLSSTVA